LPLLLLSFVPDSVYIGLVECGTGEDIFKGL
jgi:hypothetical protein